MHLSFKQFGLRVISGEDKSFVAKIVRSCGTVIEPCYSTAMRLRNLFYDYGIFRASNLGRFTISVGNITTGGTGKTPVVKWLADQLRQIGKHPAILLRGYGTESSPLSDEAQLLDKSLNVDSKPRILVEANPSRVQASLDVLCRFPATDVFVLDDGFQHRRAKRDFNLVLISATLPFGFEHVLPRGLLREPLSGLARADAFLITRCSLVSAEAVGEIDAFIRGRYPDKPIYHSDHVHSELWMPASGERSAIGSIIDQKIFLAAGIGDPAAFEKQLRSIGCKIVGSRWFSDHHGFTEPDIESVMNAAKQVGADLIVTTEKDWVKMDGKVSISAIPIGVAKLEIQFREDDGQKLMSRVEERI
jgi:tetraacyldisaccharide 4'-kinase